MTWRLAALTSAVLMLSACEEVEQSRRPLPRPDAPWGLLRHPRRRARLRALPGGEYLVRVQPELLRGGSYTLTLTLDPALAFPVENRDVGALRPGARRTTGLDRTPPIGVL